MDKQKSEKRILAENYEVSNDTWKTRLNNNDIIIGTSGAGKTSGYVIPNIERKSGSMVITDTKGNLEKKLRPQLEEDGYEVVLLDFINMKDSIVYNPLAFIRRDEDGRASERDIFSLANALMFIRDDRDPFWHESARSVLACLIACVMESLPEKEQNLCSVSELFSAVTQDRAYFGQLMLDLYMNDKESFAVREYKSFNCASDAEKCYASIMAFAGKALEVYNARDIRRIIGGEQEFRFAELGRRKMALFVNVSDTDRAFDNLVSIFYTQALQQLVAEADANEDSRLKVPVRMYMDDFATNCRIADFDKIVSVIRSREISVSVILQSLSQLRELYGVYAAETILNQFDHLIYLAGQDETTIDHVARLAGKTPDTVLRMPLDCAYVYERGSGAKLMKRYDPFRQTGAVSEALPDGPAKREELNCAERG